MSNKMNTDPLMRENSAFSQKARRYKERRKANQSSIDDRRKQPVRKTKIRPDLLARLYAVYEFFMNQMDRIPLSSGGFGRSSFKKPAKKREDSFAEFRESLPKDEDEDDDEEGEGGGTLKGLRGDEHLQEMRRLTRP